MQSLVIVDSKVTSWDLLNSATPFKDASRGKGNWNLKMKQSNHVPNGMIIYIKGKCDEMKS